MWTAPIGSTEASTSSTPSTRKPSLAYDMNGAPLRLPHGAPVRLRVERQLGCGRATFLPRIEVVDRLDHIGRGNGGTWEDDGYEWYAGI